MPNTLVGVGAVVGANPQRESETSRELDNLGKEVEHLHMVINRLAEKLAPITVQLPTSDVSGAEKRVGPSTPLASAIRIQADKVSYATQGVNSLFNRLEI
jgi:hypothetical protein